MKKAFLDVTISVCPYCEKLYADASWYVQIGSEVTCGNCKKSWVPKKTQINRGIIEMQVDEKGKITDIKTREIKT